MAQYQYLIRIVKHSGFKQRLDQVLAKLFPEYSRSQLKLCIIDGLVKVNGLIQKVPKKK